MLDKAKKQLHLYSAAQCPVARLSLLMLYVHVQQDAKLFKAWSLCQRNPEDETTNLNGSDGQAQRGQHCSQLLVFHSLLALTLLSTLSFQFGFPLSVPVSLVLPPFLRLSGLLLHKKARC